MNTPETHSAERRSRGFLQWRAGQLPVAIIIGAAIIAIGVAASALVAPYRLVGSGSDAMRLNTVTGHVAPCLLVDRPLRVVCVN